MYAPLPSHLRLAFLRHFDLDVKTEVLINEVLMPSVLSGILIDF